MRLPVLPVRAALTSDTPQTPTAAAATIWSARSTPAKSIAFSVRSSVPSLALTKWPATAPTPVRKGRRSKNVRRTSKNTDATVRPAVTDIILTAIAAWPGRPVRINYAVQNARLTEIQAVGTTETIPVMRSILVSM